MRGRRSAASLAKGVADVSPCCVAIVTPYSRPVPSPMTISGLALWPTWQPSNRPFRPGSTARGRIVRRRRNVELLIDSSSRSVFLVLEEVAVGIERRLGRLVTEPGLYDLHGQPSADQH